MPQESMEGRFFSWTSNMDINGWSCPGCWGCQWRNFTPIHYTHISMIWYAELCVHSTCRGQSSANMCEVKWLHGWWNMGHTRNQGCPSGTFGTRWLSRRSCHFVGGYYLWIRTRQGTPSPQNTSGKASNAATFKSYQKIFGLLWQGGETAQATSQIEPARGKHDGW